MIFPEDSPDCHGRVEMLMGVGVYSNAAGLITTQRDLSGSFLAARGTIARNRCGSWLFFVRGLITHQSEPRRCPPYVLRGGRRLVRIATDMDTSTTHDFDAVRLLDTTQVSELTGIPVSTLKRWRVEHGQLPFLKLGRLVRYRLSDIQTWLDGNVTEASR